MKSLKILITATNRSSKSDALNLLDLWAVEHHPFHFRKTCILSTLVFAFSYHNILAIISKQADPGKLSPMLTVFKPDEVPFCQIPDHLNTAILT